MELWTAKDAIAATGGTCSQDWAAFGVSIDTRSIKKGDLFVALKDIRDGHDFVKQALEQGAAAALVTHIPDGVDKDAPLLIVEDVLKALEDLGTASRARTNAKVIGVTGSVGKTGTKEMLRTTLSVHGKVHAAERSFNNHWGVPLTLARMPQDTDFAVIEIGMNAPGEIGPLSKMADLDCAIVTIVAPVHMAAFKNVAEIADAKAEIFEGLRAGGIAILNHDIDTYNILHKAAKKAKANIIRFGQTEGAEYSLKNAVVARDSTTVDARIYGQKQVFKLSAPGKHLGMNALAVLAACDAFDLSTGETVLALGQWVVPDGRGNRFVIQLGSISNETIDLIDESYNANPTSMEAAFDVLSASTPTDNIGRNPKGRRIAFLGDMLELGPDETQMHADLSKCAALDAIDIIHTAGPLMKSLHSAVPLEKQGECFETAHELASKVVQLLDAGDVAMVKGSNGSKISLVADAIKNLNRGNAQ